jgi:hypothetical protein
MKMMMRDCIGMMHGFFIGMCIKAQLMHTFHLGDVYPPYLILTVVSSSEAFSLSLFIMDEIG